MKCDIKGKCLVYELTDDELELAKSIEKIYGQAFFKERMERVLNQRRLQITSDTKEQIGEAFIKLSPKEQEDVRKVLKI